MQCIATPSYAQNYGDRKACTNVHIFFFTFIEHLFIWPMVDVLRDGEAAGYLSHIPRQGNLMIQVSESVTQKDSSTHLRKLLSFVTMFSHG